MGSSPTPGIFRKRLKTNRGSSYVGPVDLVGPQLMTYLMSASSDCENAGGTTKPSEGTPGCWTQTPERFQGRLQGDFPHVEPADYSAAAVPRIVRRRRGSRPRRR